MDNFASMMPENVTAQGNMIGTLDDAGKVRLTTERFGNVSGKRVVVGAPVIGNEKYAKSVADKLYSMGAKKVDFVTLGYAPNMGAGAFEDTLRFWGRYGKYHSEVADVLTNKSMQKTLRSLSQVPEYGEDVMSVVEWSESGLPGMKEMRRMFGDKYTGGQLKAVQRYAKSLKSVYENIAMKEGGPFLRDIAGKGYAPHQLSSEISEIFQDDPNKFIEMYHNRIGRIKKTDPALFEQLSEIGKRRGGHKAGRMAALLAKGGEMSEDIAHDAVRFLAEMKDTNPKAYQLFSETGQLPDLADMFLGLKHGYHSGMEPRLVFHYGKGISELNKEYGEVAQEVLGKAVKMWDDDPVRLTAGRIMKYGMVEGRRKLVKKAYKYAAKTLTIDEMDEVYPDIARILTERVDEATGVAPVVLTVPEVVGEVAESVKSVRRAASELGEATGKKEVRYLDASIDRMEAALNSQSKSFLGGRAMVLQGGEYKGHWIFPEMVNKGKVGLFDPEIGRALYESMKYNDLPGFATERANGALKALMGTMGAMGREYRASLLYYSPRRIIRDTLDDTVRGMMELVLSMPLQ